MGAACVETAPLHRGGEKGIVRAGRDMRVIGAKKRAAKVRKNKIIFNIFFILSPPITNLIFIIL